ncbi:MAG TPA: hypothetical protein VN428_10310 [Bryobacteraceae bacterium]|nr:hypothetical protein [Bryobacteraceae bacterium]
MPADRVFVPSVAVRIPTRLIVRVAFAVLALLTVASFTAGIMRHVFGIDTAAGLIRQFNFDDEANLPTFFSALCLGACSAAMFLASAVSRRSGDGLAARWNILGIIFAAMTVDEIAQLHETLMQLIWKVYRPGGMFHYVWVIPGMIFVVVVAAAYLKFLFRLPRATRNGLMVAGAIYVAGALGMELVSGAYVEAHPAPDLTRFVLNTIEEALEVVGLILCFGVVGRHLAAAKAEISLRID